MEKMLFNRVHLDSLSTKELINLAEANGIDIPEGLNRRFIIGELLDLHNEILVDSMAVSDLADTKVFPKKKKLPFTYNETMITALLRDPGWIFVFWDFHTNVVQSSSIDCFFLRVNSLKSRDSTKAEF